VLPVNDLIEHERSDDCICGPDTRFFAEDGTMYDMPVVLHHSLDGRELAEQ
jgi:hypothetical protein